MATRKTATARSAGEVLGLKLLESVRQMKARNFARATAVAVNEVVEARHGTRGHPLVTTFSLPAHA